MNRPIKRIDFIQNYLSGIFAEDLHAKHVTSLANGTLGVMTGASLAVSIIGQSLAQARGLLLKEHRADQGSPSAARNGAWRGSRQDEREAPGCLSGFGFAVKLSAGPEGAPPAGGRCPGLGERDPTLSIIALYLRTTIS